MSHASYCKWPIERRAHVTRAARKHVICTILCIIRKHFLWLFGLFRKIQGKILEGGASLLWVYEQKFRFVWRPEKRKIEKE